MWKALLCTAILAHASFGVWAASGKAESYPNKPIRLILGFPPGGTSDVLARIIGPRITERLGQTVIVDNRPGAAGNLAAELAARANPDGYTLMMAVNPNLSSSPSLYKKLGYDLMRDFTYVTTVATGANVMLAHPSLPVKSVSELVALARAKPKAIRYGSSGVASPHHLAGELLQSRTGIQLVHVPYKGGAPVVAALIAGEVQIGFSSVTAAIPMVNAKRVNAIAITSGKRAEALPGVPTVAESGIPGFDVTLVLGILAPAGTPAAVVKRLNAEIRNVLQMEDIKAKFVDQGTEARGSTPDEYRALMKAEIAQWARVVKDAGITAN